MTAGTQGAAAEQKEQFERDGFSIITRPVIPADVVGRASAGMAAVRSGVYDTGVPPLSAPQNDPTKLCKMEMPQIASHAIMELVSYPAIGELAAALTGATMVQVWWVQLLVKPGSSTPAANIGWHQDWQYWQEWEEGSELFTAWCALSDVTADSGPMKFVRGSHRWGFLGQGDFFESNREAQRARMGIPAGHTWEEVAAVLPPGGVSFHHHLTYHGSGPNLSAEPRRSFAVHLRTEKSRPRNGVKKGLTTYIDDLTRCPVIYGHIVP